MRKVIFSFFAVIYFSLLFTYADEDWRTEFDYICGKTEESMTMKLEELKDLITRCEKLKPVIENLDHPQKKVFLKRIEMCKNLFGYMLEVREKEKK